METFPVDIDPEQIVRWVMAKTSSSTRRHSEFPHGAPRNAGNPKPERDSPRGSGTRGHERSRYHSDFVEIAPFHSSDDWRLIVVVEDEAGPLVPDRMRLRTERKRSILVPFMRSSSALDGGA